MAANHPDPIDPQALEEAAEWLMSMNAGEACEAQQAAWMIWRNSSVERERAWQRAELLMGKLAGLPAAVSLSALERPADPGRRVLISRLALLLAVGPAGWMAWNLAERQAWAADYRSAIGECRELVLADGSQVFLNTDSAVDVRFDAHQRLIHLRRGEILVQTAVDTQVPARPLWVATAEGRMQALGTRFVVREAAGRTYLAVIEGAVRVQPSNTQHAGSRVVMAGERTDFDGSALRPVQPADKSVGAWIQGMLLADKMRLQELVSELARYRRGFIRCDPLIADLPVSGAFPVSDWRRTVNMLVATYPVAVSEHMNGYWTLLSAR
ncbi:transmembrane sensor [Pseudomonas hunanensis]|uniref:Transmembrane sensor n=1 Tax=Pseudomonas hunanensis TaxID=1247546 RepID=A0ACC6KA68_9PSED|nr:FecR family protein [Pseudomonas hunanensis]MDR6715378.1 transmembrane sensor [Pseudomonas hunanensis]